MQFSKNCKACSKANFDQEQLKTSRYTSSLVVNPALPPMRSLFAPLFSLAAASAFATLTHAQSFPSKPVTLVVPVTPGGSTDLMARQMAEPLGKALGQTVIVENRPGASGNIAASYVAKAKPDGHILLAAYSAFHAANPFLFKNLDWDPVKDFVPIALVLDSAQAIAVSDKLPVKTFKELVAYIKANPGKLNYGTAGAGSLHHISGALLEQLAGGAMTAVAYKGTGPAVTDLAGGSVDIVITTPPGVLPLAQAGKIRILAVTGNKRVPSLPNVPTTSEEGFPNFSVNAWFGFVAPKGTPDEIVKRLSDEMAKVAAGEGFKKGVEGAGGAIAFQDFKQFDGTIKRDIEMFKRVIAEKKITAE
jgi:tripartite-type tricarboxylate transporter receptor subunit TctC